MARCRILERYDRICSTLARDKTRLCAARSIDEARDASAEVLGAPISRCTIWRAASFHFLPSALAGFRRIRHTPAMMALTLNSIAVNLGNSCSL